MINLFLIGVTGGIGSGKSLVCQIFRVLGIPVYNADDRAKWLLNNDQILKKQVVQTFGPEAYDARGNLNRSYLSHQVFNDSNQIEKLNQLVHPRVGNDFQNWVEKNSQHQLLIKEAALLFESGSYRALNFVITVNAPESLRVHRVLLRDPQRTEADVKAIMGKQMDDAEKNSLADYVLNNDEQGLLVPKVLKLYEKLKERAKRDKTNP